MIETSSIIEAIYYLLKRIGPSDKLKLVKLMYLADKYHLIRYGRTITNDEYFAMPHGPVGSTIKDVLSLDHFSLSYEEYNYTSQLLKKVSKNQFKASDKEIEFEMLSETDIEALDFIANKFGQMSTWKLRDYTHEYPEWRQYQELFEDKRTKRERLNTKELLSILENDPLAMPANHIKESENLLTGNYQ